MSATSHAPRGLPDEIAPRRLARRTAEVVLLLGLLVLVVVLAPGLGEVRDRLADASAAWLAVAVVLEFLSCASYVLLFRAVFCRTMPWRTSWDISWTELGVGSIVPASGAGGLALGAWILDRRGMPRDRIARRSVAFFLLKSSVNFLAVAILGFLLATGIVGPPLSLWLTALPATLATLTILGVVLLPRFGPGADPDADASKPRRWWSVTRRAVIGGTAEAVDIARSHDVLVVGGAIGYWIFDNAVLWATFHAVGASVPLTVILMGYLIGQLGGLLPIPGGIGGIDGGLIGTLIVFGAPAAATAAAVLAYRIILFWLPLLIGAASFVSLRRTFLRRPDAAPAPG